MEDLKEQEQIRRAKLEKYLEKGINPFGHKFNVTSNSHLIKEMASGKDHDQLEAEQINVSIAGRIMMLRRMGKVTFFHLLDRQGMIQCYIRKDVVGDEAYELLDLADLGDIVGVTGTLMLTKTAEITVRVNEYTHLVKALRPLPDKYHGLSDVEERYRRRYVDLIVNEQAREVAIKRNKIIRTIQAFMDNLGYLEFETSVLQPILGGASARPFVVHHNALSNDFYLRIATELPLKRLLVGGLEKVYEIGRLFRNEGIDTKHNPEFTTMEAYLAYGDLEDMRILAENLFKEVALKVNGSLKLPWGDKVIDLEQPFEKISMVDLIKRETGIDFSIDMSLEDALKLAKQHHIQLEPHQKTYGHIINEFFELYCEKKLIQPTFVYHHPIEISPLARKSADPRFTERFELFVDGSEYANAFTELNNPIDQLERFKSQLKARELGDLEANEIDSDFVEALEYGMPPAGGIGIGIDRLVMLMTNNQSIREVILFPLLRHK